MAIKHYDWGDAKLDEHSKKKHKILREYFRQYLITRCKLPQQEKFRLAVIDGFSGGGRYSCGGSGSPLIFVETLKDAFIEINTLRAANGMKAIEFECYLIFNDAVKDTIELLKTNLAPLLAEIKTNHPTLHIQAKFLNCAFDHVYPEIKSMLNAGRYGNVIFNLDQYGSSDVNRQTIKDIFQTWKSAEAFLTFAIETVIAFLSTDKEKNSVLTQDESLLNEIYALNENSVLNKNSWLGLAEKMIFSKLMECASYTSPFSIHNPNGWRYWLIHFANSHRARQVYNNVLHENDNSQVHYGRAGLKMLAYDPANEGQLYLFDEDSRKAAKQSLYDDIPRLILDQGDTMPIMEFYANVYSETPAHSDDIHDMMLENPDIEVLTPSGNPRRSANTITSEDTLRIKMQKSFFPIFLRNDK